MSIKYDEFKQNGLIVDGHIITIYCEAILCHDFTGESRNLLQ